MPLGGLFSVSYGEEGFICRRRAPHADWVERGRPSCAAFLYSCHCWHDVLRIVYVPGDNTVHVMCDLDYYYVSATLLVDVREEAKEVRVAGVTCLSENDWPSLTGGPPSMIGSVRAFRKNLCYLADLDIVDTLIGQFFGDGGWRFVLSEKQGGKRVKMVPAEVHKAALKALKRMTWYSSGPWSRTVGTYDLSRDDAATRIQAAWRGWRVRIELRCSPHNRLGRHLIQRMFHPDAPTLPLICKTVR